MVLRLFDVSQFIHSGSKSLMWADGVVEEAEIYTPREISVGGLAYLIEEIKRYVNPETDIVFCLDGIPLKKREIMDAVFPEWGGYKGQRPQKRPEISFQRDIVQEFLESMNANVIHRSGYEADDIIASIVRYYKDSYDKVYIHSRDSDLYYLVDSKVECVPVGRSGKHVTLTNWETTVCTGKVIKYNTLTLSKMLHGERGDNIPAAPTDIVLEIMNKWPEDKYAVCGDNDVLEQVIRTYSKNDKKTVAVMQLIMPLIIPEDELYIQGEEFDLDLLNFYLHSLSGEATVYSYAAKEKGTEVLNSFVNRWMEI